MRLPLLTRLKEVKEVLVQQVCNNMNDFKKISEDIISILVDKHKRRELEKMEEFKIEYMNKNKWMEGLEKEGLLYLYLVSLVSADSLLTIEDCEESLKEIEYCLEILPENDIKDKEKIRQMLLEGKEIVLRDLDILKNESNG